MKPAIPEETAKDKAMIDAIWHASCVLFNGLPEEDEIHLIRAIHSLATQYLVERRII